MVNRDTPISRLSWEEYSNLDIKTRCSYLNTTDGPYHVILSQQFDRERLDYTCALATKIRTIAKTKEGSNFLSSLLNHKRAMLYFVQPSSRTFLSFLSACKILGIRSGETRDVSTSSEIKGESQIDTVRILASYFDFIIMRHPSAGFAEKIAWVLENSDRPVPVINGGSGADQHPTQALLDLYTLQRSFEDRGGIDNKKIAIVGDLARGRTARSLARLLVHYNNVQLVFVSPETLKMRDDVKQELEAARTPFYETNQFMSVLPEVDAVYMMRIQDEYDIGIDNSSINYQDFHMTAKHLEALKKDAIIMHPLPKRDEISMAVDRDPRAMYWRQVRNGMWARTALISQIFKVDKDINAYNI